MRVKHVINSVSKNKFLQILSANGIVTLLKTAIALVSNKIIAVYIGPSGVALVGQMNNFLSIVMLSSSGGFNQGITKYISEYKANEKVIAKYVTTALVATTILSLLSGIIMLFISKTISIAIFSNVKYYSIFVVFAFTLILYNWNNLFIAIINGFQNYKLYFKVNLSTTVVGALLSIFLVIFFDEFGALLSIVLSQSIVFIFTFLVLKNQFWFKQIALKLYDNKTLKTLLKFSLVTILGAILWPIVKIYIRTIVINNISAYEAGLWEATLKLNDYVVNIAMGSIAVYVLPRLSEVTDKIILKKEILNVYKIIIPITLLGFAGMYLFREQVFLILYSKEFIKASDYLLLQMIGSFFWMCKIIPMNLMLSKSKTFMYLGLELFFCGVYFIIANVLIPYYGVQGIQMSFLIYNLLYLVVSLYIMYKYFLS